MIPPDTLAALRGTLLPKLLSGNLRRKIPGGPQLNQT